MKRPLKLIVVGAVAAGTRAASKARRSDPSMEITLITQEQNIAYAGCGLPYYIGGVITDRNRLFARTPEAFREKQGIDVRLGVRAERINTFDQILHVRNLSDGSVEKLPYDRLLIATGAKPVLPPVEGIDLPGIFTLHSVTDADSIMQFIGSRTIRNAAIIGAGYIGCEMAEAFTDRGISVDMFEMAGSVMPRMFDADMAAHLSEHLSSKGVRFHPGTKIDRIEGDSSVTGVKSGGTNYPADIVLVAAGVAPNTELAREARIVLGESGAIKVDSRMESSVRGIFAAGDCTETTHLVSGKATWLPLGSTANKMGRVAGANIAGANKQFPGITGTSIVKVFDLAAGRTGLNEDEARSHGFNPISTTVKSSTKAGYYPGGEEITVKMTADRKSGRILGVQAVGTSSVDKIIDSAASALAGKLAVDDLTALDLAYSPPFSPSLGPLIVAAQVLDEKL